MNKKETFCDMCHNATHSEKVWEGAKVPAFKCGRIGC